MNGDSGKTIELLSNAKTAAILLPKNPGDALFLLKAAFKAAFKELNISLISLPDENGIYKKISGKWDFILKESSEEDHEPERPKTIIRIPKKDFLIKELSYDENEDFFSFVITSKEGKLIKEGILLEEAPPDPDTILCFFNGAEQDGQRPLESVFLSDAGGKSREIENFRNKIKIRENMENILFFAPREPARNFGGQEKILTEKIANLLQLLQVNFAGTVTDALFAALVLETNRFRNNLSKEIFSLSEFLLSQGARAKEIYAFLDEEKQDSFSRILGRSLARSDYSERFNAFFSFLGGADFEKTNNAYSNELILKIINELTAIAKPAEIYALFFEKEGGIFSLIKPFKEDVFYKLAINLNLKPESDYLLAGPFPNFSEAEAKVKDALSV